MRTEEYKIMTINQFADYTSKTYNYSNRLGNLTVEAVGVIHTSVCLCGSVLVVGDQHVFYASTAVSAGFL